MREQTGRKEIHLSIDDLFFELIPKDYIQFMKEVNLATTPRQKEILAAQSCHGHAINGDKQFTVFKESGITHYQYPNATISDIYDAIIKSMPDFAENTESVKRERHNLIAELKGWVIEAINSLKSKSYVHRKYQHRKLLDRDGEPLMGIEFFRHTAALNDPRSVLIGLYLGSYMDSEHWREQTEDYFKTIHNIPFSMHRGLCTAANLENIIKEGLTLSDMSHLACLNGMASRYTLETLKEKQMIADFDNSSKKLRKYGVRNKNPFVPVYVELNRGYGSSDDAAFNFVSLMHGLEAGFGLLLADAVDTIDKCIVYIKERGEDELLGDYIRDQLGGREGVKDHLGITDQDIINLIFAAAIDKDHPNKWPSCSQRRFLQLDKKGNYAFLNHIAYIKHVSEGARYPENIKLSIKEISSDEFYDAFKGRIQKMLDLNLISVDNSHYPKNLSYFLKK